MGRKNQGRLIIACFALWKARASSLPVICLIFSDVDLVLVVELAQRRSTGLSSSGKSPASGSADKWFEGFRSSETTGRRRLPHKVVGIDSLADLVRRRLVRALSSHRSSSGTGGVGLFTDKGALFEGGG
jgi:hypothetical protein